MQAAGATGLASTNILLHPQTSRAVVESSNRVVAAVADFHERLGIERDRQHLGPKRWVDALAEVRDKAIETGAGAVDSARTLGTGAVDKAKTAAENLAIDLAEQALRRRAEEEARKQGEAIEGPKENEA
jgi:hypothetical protein